MSLTAKRFRRVGLLPCASCGHPTYHSLSLYRDGAITIGTFAYCPDCIEKKTYRAFALPRINNGWRHSAFGVANGDSQSPTQSSIPNWGGKIKARKESR